MSRFNFLGWRKKLSISEQDPSYKVRYLGNVQTSMMKGEGCVDRPVNTIWNSYLRSPHPGLEMKLVLTASGLKAYTKEQGLTEYRAHRISYCIAHPQHPKLFVWVYRHEGRRLKMELRCHAVLCQSEAKAKAMALQLHDKLSQALQEFQREKLRKQNSRLLLQRTNSLPKAGSVLPLRKQLLSTATNFKPPSSKSTTAPKLGSIHEDFEEEEEEEEYDVSTTLEQTSEGDSFIEEREMLAASTSNASSTISTTSVDLDRSAAMIEALNLESCEAAMEDLRLHVPPLLSMEVGNDVEQLRCDRSVQRCVAADPLQDSDEESTESGFHDQDDSRGAPGAAGEDDAAVRGSSGGASVMVSSPDDEEEGEVLLNPLGDEVTAF